MTTTTLHKEWWNSAALRRQHLLGVTCRYCKAEKGKPCTTKSGRPVGTTISWHSARYASAGHPAYKPRAAIGTGGVDS